MKTINNFIKIIIFLVVLNGGILLITYVLTPKIPSFYREKHYDAVFFGTSQSYCSFDPLIFDEYDLKTYNRGRQQQTMNYTYYYIKDALDVCDIDVVVLEVFGMFYEEDDTGFISEGVRDSSLNDMRMSETKIEAIRECVPEEMQISYFFPLDKYHFRWEELDYASWNGFYNSSLKEADRGYKRWTESEVCVDDYWSIAFSEIRRDVYAENIKYLDKIYELCQKKGAKLILVKAPLPCYDRVIEETNSLDGGTHLNESGAGKVSKHLAAYLKENYFE